MKHLIALCLVLSSAAFAESTLTCQLKTKNKSVSVVTSLSKINPDGVTSDGVNVGRDNYSFSMTVEKTGTNAFSLMAIVYENNHVQDEVGEFSCDFALKAGSNVVCNEPLEMDGKKIGDLVCTAKK